ncbi:MAG: RagB/SusD family nutrient uptake outer membrane protein [Bacteroidota bacterium]
MKANKLIFIATLTVLSACSKDFLELDPQGMQFEDNFYANKTEIYEGLLAAYDLTTQKFTGAYTYHSSYMMRNIASDDANCGGGNALDMIDWQAMDEFSATSTNTALMAHWWRSYFGIYRCNQIIVRVDPHDFSLYEVPTDSIIIKKYIAEAKFLRAYFNYELVTFFGGVPIVKEFVTAADPYPTKSTAEEVWAFIEQDLEEAIPDLPRKSEQGPAELAHASKGAAQALLGKAYLFQKKYDEAAIVLEDLIGTGDYMLDPEGYAHIFSAAGEFGPESIYELSYTNTGPADWTANNTRAYDGNVDVQMMGVRELSGASEYNPGWGFNKAEPSLVNAFLDEGDMIRMNVSIYSTDTLKAHEPAVTWNSDYKYTGWYCNKYAPKKDRETDGVGAKELDYNVNEIVFRYADVLLMAAEAHMFKSTPNEGLTHGYINEIRNRVGLGDIDAGLSGNDLFLALVKERRLELAMEGQRYLDLIRWGLAPTVLVDQPQAESNNYGSFVDGVNEYFPIPHQEIDRSNGALEQNPAYL